eukprot:365988-Chlamydomonas_euryale.AAC.3
MEGAIRSRRHPVQCCAARTSPAQSSPASHLLFKKCEHWVRRCHRAVPHVVGQGSDRRRGPRVRRVARRGRGVALPQRARHAVLPPRRRRRGGRARVRGRRAPRRGRGAACDARRVRRHQPDAGVLLCVGACVWWGARDTRTGEG